ncbi:MAG: DNA repair protein RecN [Oscillospiraceae bacterium]|nr:DNA repair protein RecN [Candidatus Equicaccousia limihippi]
MLKYLYIENIAVIESAKINFDAGFSVLTGETGSGKSIVIDSIMAILGERTGKELIRNGSDFANVSAEFCDLSDDICKFLAENGYGTGDNSLAVSRTLNLDGKNTVRVNDRASTVGFLKQLSSKLINVHGQHSNQLLLNKENHRNFLDEYINDTKIFSDYKTAFDNYMKIRKLLKATYCDEDEKQRTAELLKYQIEEIENAGLNIGEADKLSQRLHTLKNAEKTVKYLQSVLNLIKGGEETSGVSTALQDAEKIFVKLQDNSPNTEKRFAQIISLKENALALSEDLEGDISGLDFSDAEFERCEDRLSLIKEITAKYGGTEESALKFFNDAKDRLSGIENNDAMREKLENEIETAENVLIKEGEKLTELRKKYAASLSEKIENELKQLDFSNARFVVDIQKGKYSADGCDEIEFLISANAGEEPKPLIKVASGGELSRIMLAIRSILCPTVDARTLIFDEIDSGISGIAADKVAQKLKSIAQNYQVICVTHLAQIAAKGDNHLLVNKSVRDNKTYTTVDKIDGETRIKEIARIISGEHFSENIYNSAKEMLGE